MQCVLCDFKRISSLFVLLCRKFGFANIAISPWALSVAQTDRGAGTLPAILGYKFLVLPLAPPPCHDALDICSDLPSKAQPR